jgi:hypothetical protein
LTLRPRTAKKADAGFKSHLLGFPVIATRDRWVPGTGVERRLFGGGSGMDMEGFRDKADDAITQGEEEVDERTGGRFDEQTDRATDEARERGEGILGDQQGDEPQQ